VAVVRADQAGETAEARVAAAKLRLMQAARDADRPPALVSASASLLRDHPWRGVAIAFAAGVVLGLAPQRTMARLGPLIGPLIRNLPLAAALANPAASDGGQQPTPSGRR